MSFVIWLACGLLSLLGALSYAELGTMNTSSGAEYAYFMDAFGAPPAFLFSWASTLVLKPSQMAIICLSFGKYAVEAFVTECEPPEIVVKMVALLAMGIMILFYFELVEQTFIHKLTVTRENNQFVMDNFNFSTPRQNKIIPSVVYHELRNLKFLNFC